MSDDVMITLSAEQYREFEIPVVEMAGEPFGGAAFHSCGNWSAKTDAVGKIANLVMVDGAFSAQTDPHCNPVSPFVESFSDTGVAVNARIVGEPAVVIDKVKRLWTPNMKLVAVTYCRSPQEQDDVYTTLNRLLQ